MALAQAAALWTLAIAAPASAQAEELELVSSVQRHTTLDARGRKTERLSRQDPGALSVKRIQIDASAVQRQPAQLKVSFPGGSTYRLTQRRSGSAGDGLMSWEGVGANGVEASFVADSSGVSGTIRDRRGRILELRHLQGSLHALVEHDPSRRPPDHRPGDEVIDGGAPRGPEALQPSTDASALVPLASPKISILIMYTPAGAAHVGNVNTTSSLAVTDLNTSFTNSDVSMTAELAGVGSFATEYAKSVDAVAPFRNDARAIQERNRVNADIVILVGKFSDPRDCGAAPVLATPQTAFAAVNATCLISNYSMSHEIGHLFGGLHNREVSPEMTPYPEGHGWWFRKTEFDGWVGCERTIMSYPLEMFSPTPKCSNDVRRNMWSNPYKSWRDSPAGNVSFAYDASVLNRRAATVAAFSDTKLSAPTTPPSHPPSSVTTSVVNILSSFADVMED